MTYLHMIQTSQQGMLAMIWLCFTTDLICAETSKKKKTPDEKSTFLCIDGDNGGVGRVRQLEPAHL